MGLQSTPSIAYQSREQKKQQLGLTNKEKPKGRYSSPLDGTFTFMSLAKRGNFTAQLVVDGRGGGGERRRPGEASSLGYRALRSWNLILPGHSYLWQTAFTLRPVNESASGLSLEDKFKPWKGFLFHLSWRKGEHRRASATHRGWWKDEGLVFYVGLRNGFQV